MRSTLRALLVTTLLPGLLAFPVSSFAQSGTWNTTNTAQLWSATNNWLAGTVASGSGNTALFNAVDITADTTVQFDTARTIGNLTFGDTNTNSAAGWILDNNGSATNILTLAGGTPTITVGTLGTNKGVTISAEIAGSSGLAKAGAGTLFLSATNSYSGTTSIGGGVLGISHANALGSSSAFATNGGELHLSGGITVTNAISSSGAGASLNGSLQSVSGSNTVTSYSLANNVGTRIGVSSGAVLNLPNTIGATNGQGFRFIGGGTLILGGTNTTIWSNGIGSTIGLSGVGGLTLKLGSDLAMGNSVIDFAAATTVQSADGAARNISNNLTFSVTNLVTLGAASTGNITNSGTVAIGGAVNLAVSNSQTALLGVISGGGAGTLTKSGTGTMVLGGTSTNTFSGSTVVSEGVLQLNKTAGVNAVAGNLTITNGGRVAWGANNQIADGATVTMSGSNSILNGTGVNTGVTAPTETIAALTVTGGGVQTGGGSTWNVTGASSFTGGATNGTFFGGYSGSSFTTASLSLSAMTGTAGSTLGTPGFFVYGNSTSSVASVTVGGGGLALDGSVVNLRKGTAVGALGSELRLEGNVTTTGTTASSIAEDTSGGTTTGTVSLALSATNTGAVTRTFNVGGGGANLSVGVRITDGVSSAGSLSKTGAGTLTLSGSNSYTGTTTVSNGTLQLNSAAGGAAGSTTNVVVSGGILLISQSNQMNDSAAVTLSGGTIQRGSAVTETFGNLNLTTASFMDFGTGTASSLNFGTYTGGGFKLSVNNFLVGNVLTFKTNLSGSITNTSLFAFDNGFTSNWNGGTSTFTITAIPEPSTIVAALGLAGLMLWTARRRLLRMATSTREG